MVRILLPKVDLRDLNNIVPITAAYLLAELSQKERQQQILQIIGIDFFVGLI